MQGEEGGRFVGLCWQLPCEGKEGDLGRGSNSRKEDLGKHRWRLGDSCSCSHKRVDGEAVTVLGKVLCLLTQWEAGRYMLLVL